MSSYQQRSAPSRRWSPGFWTGLAAGLIGLPLALFVTLLLYLVLVSGLGRYAVPQRNYASAGEELSRVGVTSVIWQRPDETLRQTCRGICDDITFGIGPRPRAVEVEDAPDAHWRPTLKAFP